MSRKRVLGVLSFSIDIFGGVALATTAWSCMFYITAPGNKTARGFAVAASDGMLMPMNFMRTGYTTITGRGAQRPGSQRE